MVVSRARGLANITLLMQMVMVSAAYWLWSLMWEWVVGIELVGAGRLLFYNEFLLLGILLSSPGARPSLGRVTSRPSSERIRTARRQTLGALFGVFAVMIASRDAGISRSFLFSFAPVLYLLLRWSHHVLPAWFATLCFNPERPNRAVLIGPPDQVKRVLVWLREKAPLGLKPLGVIWGGNGSAREDVDGLPVLGGLASLETVLTSQGVHEVFLLGLSWPGAYLRECVTVCERRGVRLLVVSDLEDKFLHSVTLFEDSGLQFIGLREEPLEDPIHRALKRLLDIAIALPVTLFLLPPVTVVVWALLRWQSPGPVFFRQFRSGMQGRRFLMLKYRTMHLENDDETRQVRREDPRVFTAGHWMRRLSIDELPQFINVLRGEMSVVGPRPHIPAHDDIFVRAMNSYRVRSVVKPGLTGLAQVRGFRGGTFTDEDVARRVTADIEYLERWTLELDIWIIFRTFFQMFVPPRNAF